MFIKNVCVHMDNDLDLLKITNPGLGFVLVLHFHILH